MRFKQKKKRSGNYKSDVAKSLSLSAQNSANAMDDLNPPKRRSAVGITSQAWRNLSLSAKFCKWYARPKTPKSTKRSGNSKSIVAESPSLSLSLPVQNSAYANDDLKLPKRRNATIEEDIKNFKIVNFFGCVVVVVVLPLRRPLLPFVDHGIGVDQGRHHFRFLSRSRR